MQGEVTTFRHTLSAAGSPYAMVETNPSGTVLKTQYLHADHQGSIKAVSDTSGAVIERMGYDAWGKRSDALSHSTTRGYTAHEMLDNVGLIHMNGRVYDPLLARFLSVDPINQAPDNAQSYNPYSYVFNSPMMFTDPSGFSAWVKYRRPVVGIAASVLTYGMATYAMTGVWFADGVANVGLAKFGASVMAGGVGGGIQSGTVEGALKGAAMAAAFYGVGSGAEQIASAGGTNAAIAARSVQVVGHAAVACAGAVASGGQCGPAALAQGFTSGVSPYLPDGYVAGTAAHAVVGGLAARLAGGDSRQGALTGAYAYLFNETAHELGKQLENQAALEIQGQGSRILTNRKIVFENGQQSEIDIIGRQGNDISVTECKNGACARWTPNQRANIQALAEGRYYVKGAQELGIKPDVLVRDQGNFTAGLYTQNATRVMRSPTTASFVSSGGMVIRSFTPFTMLLDAYFMAKDYQNASRCSIGGFNTCAPSRMD